jgi:hypothetical protein
MRMKSKRRLDSHGLKACMLSVLREPQLGHMTTLKNSNTVREELEQRFLAQWEKVTKDSSKMKTYRML